MHSLPLLVNVGVALAYALVGGLIARRIGLPPLVGYMLAGMAISPVSPGWVGDPDTIRQLAELGVILLMFGIGLHFSFRDLWQVRDIAIPGAVVQMGLITGAGAWLALSWGFSTGGAWVFGIAASVASTVVMLRGFTDNGLLDTHHGKVAIGWLVVEDLITVVVLVLLPVFFGPIRESGWTASLAAIGGALVFVGVMVGAGRWVVPALLGRVVHTRSRELFVLVALTMAVGTALVSSHLFGVSLALGAFVAGVVVSESPFSHQVSADLLPFREAFAVLFFVSVGMLVNPVTIAEHWREVAALTALIVMGKAVVSAAICFILPYPARTALYVAAGRAQIGEFSFIVGQSGLALGLLTDVQYSLILAGAILSITLNPLLFRLVPLVERALKAQPRLWALLNRHGPPMTLPGDALEGHVVIVGCGRVGRHIAEVLAQLQIPRLVIESDPSRLEKLQELGVPVMFGDAANAEILQHASLPKARTLVVTVPDDKTAAAVVMAARRLAPNLHVIARASNWDGARRLREEGAAEIVRPELEGGVEIVRRTLIDLELPLTEVIRYTDFVRREGLDETESPSAERARVLHDLIHAADGVEMRWCVVEAGSAVDGRSLADSELRPKTGASVVAIARTGALVSNPGPEEILRAGDRVGLIGAPAELNQAERVLSQAG